MFPQFTAAAIHQGNVNCDLFQAKYRWPLTLVLLHCRQLQIKEEKWKLEPLITEFHFYLGKNLCHFDPCIIQMSVGRKTACCG